MWAYGFTCGTAGAEPCDDISIFVQTQEQEEPLPVQAEPTDAEEAADQVEEALGTMESGVMTMLSETFAAATTLFESASVPSSVEEATSLVTMDLSLPTATTVKGC